MKGIIMSDKTYLNSRLTRLQDRMREAKAKGESAYKKHKELDNELMKSLDVETYSKVLDFMYSKLEYNRHIESWAHDACAVDDLKDQLRQLNKPLWKKILKKK